MGSTIQGVQRHEQLQIENWCLCQCVPPTAHGLNDAHFTGVLIPVQKKREKNTCIELLNDICIRQILKICFWVGS